MEKTNLRMPEFMKADFSKFDLELSGLEINAETSQFESFFARNKFENSIFVFDDVIKFFKLDSNLEVWHGVGNAEAQAYKKLETDDKVLYFNKQYLNSFLKVRTKPNTEHPKLYIWFLTEKNCFHYSKIEIEKSSKLEIFEGVVSLKTGKFNKHLEITAKENAIANFFAFQRLSSNNSSVFTHNIFAHKNARVETKLLNLNQSDNMNITYGNLLAEGAEIDFSSATFAGGQTISQSLTKLVHFARHTQSNIQNIAVANQNAKLVFDGIGQIEKGFSKSEAQQKTRVILISPKARVVVNPQLIINEFDVKAGHAAAVSGLDEEQIFYLQSRGLSKTQATKLLLLSYAEEFLAKLPPEMKEEIVDLIEEKIEQN